MSKPGPHDILRFGKEGRELFKYLVHLEVASWLEQEATARKMTVGQYIRKVLTTGPGWMVVLLPGEGSSDGRQAGG